MVYRWVHVYPTHKFPYYIWACMNCIAGGIGRPSKGRPAGLCLHRLVHQTHSLPWIALLLQVGCIGCHVHTISRVQRKPLLLHPFWWGLLKFGMHHTPPMHVCGVTPLKEWSLLSVYLACLYCEFQCMQLLEILQSMKNHKIFMFCVFSYTGCGHTQIQHILTVYAL